MYRVFNGANNSTRSNSCIPKNGVSQISPKNYTNILKTVHENIDSYVGKKICFTSFKSNLPSAYYVNKELCPWKDKKYDLSDYVIYHALQPYQYDIFDMLLYGKRTDITI